MILLDSNVLIYASEPGARYRSWATDVIVDAVSAAGAAVNAVSLAEICVGAEDPDLSGCRNPCLGDRNP